MQTNSNKKMIVSPSILAADPLNLAAEIVDVENGGADWHHIDVMDGHFVPNLTFGLPLIKSLKKVSKIPLDVHIMISNPDEVALDYVDAGADILTFHAEAAVHSHRLIQAIQAKGSKAGVAINPGTPLSLISPLLPTVDVVMLMSVNPGFGGQKFIPETIGRIEEIAAELKRIGRDDVVVEIDGGITDQNIDIVREAGVTAVVAGSFVFKSSDRKKAIESLK